MEYANQDQLKAICDVAKKILQGSININQFHREKLRQFKDVIRSLSSPQINLTRKKRTLIAFHQLIPLLLHPVMHLFDEI